MFAGVFRLDFSDMKSHHTKRSSSQSSEADAAQQQPPQPAGSQQGSDSAPSGESPVAPAAGTVAATSTGPQAAAPAAEQPRAEPKIDPMLERLMRLQADFENFRKRVARERIEMAQRASEDVMKDLLPALDHFEIALKGAAEHGAPASVVEGLELVFDELMGALAKHGLAAIRVEPGTPFDPHQHEAVAYTPSAEIPEGGVVQQTRGGYRLGEKLLRPAQVVVSSGSAAAEP